MRTRAIVGIVAATIVIVAMVWVADPGTLFENMGRSDPFYILLVILLYFANTVTKAVRWALLVSSTGGKAPFSRILPFYIIALAFNNIVPGKVAGEPVRAYLLKRENNVPVGLSMASIFTEKMLDLIVVTAMALIGALIILPLLTPLQGEVLLVIIAIVIAAIVALLVVVSRSDLLDRVIRWTAGVAKRVSKRESVQRLGSAAIGFTERFRSGIARILEDRSMGAVSVGLTVLIWVNEALRLYIILLALPEATGASIGAVFIASSIANILGLALPLGAGGILGIGAVFIAVGMDPTMASVASFMHVATSIWISVPLCLVAMAVTGMKLSRVTEKV